MIDVAEELRPAGAAAARLRQGAPEDVRHEIQAKGVPEYVRHDLRAKVFGVLFAHSAVLLALAKLAVLLLPSPWPAESLGVFSWAPAPGDDETESSGNGHTFLSVVGMIGVPIFAGILLRNIIGDVFGAGRRTQYEMYNVLLAVAGQWDFQLRILLPELLFILSTTLFLATGINLALSARLRACSHHLVRDSVVQGRWTGRGVVLAGVKVAGPAPSALPSLPLLLAWLAAAWLGRAHAGVHWDAVIASFTVVWLFLIDADGPLRSGDPDDHLRIVVLFHSKVGLLPLTAALAWLCVPIFGPSGYTLLAGVVLYVSLRVTKYVLHSWPGPPPAEVERQRPLEIAQRELLEHRRQIDALQAEQRQQQLELERQHLERLHLQRQLEIAQRQHQRQLEIAEREQLECQRLLDALQAEQRPMIDAPQQDQQDQRQLIDALQLLLDTLRVGIKCYVIISKYRTFKMFRDLIDAFQLLLDTLRVGIKWYVIISKYRTFKMFRDFTRLWHSLRL